MADGVMDPLRTAAGPPSSEARDREVVAPVADPERQEVIARTVARGLRSLKETIAKPRVIARTVQRYRRADRLEVGDPVPPLSLTRRDGADEVRVDGYIGDRPLVLIFGSCT